MDQIVTALITTLMKAHHLEDAADSVLAPMLRRSAEVLAASRFGKRGRIMRGMVHIRPGDGYRHLVILEAGNRGPSLGEEDKVPPAFLPSATAWRWVVEQKCAVSIDVHTGKVEAHLG